MDDIRPVISDKVITVYKNGHGIHEVLRELEKGAIELKRRERLREAQQRAEDATYENEKNSSMQTSQKKETK